MHRIWRMNLLAHGWCRTPADNWIDPADGSEYSLPEAAQFLGDQLQIVPVTGKTGHGAARADAGGQLFNSGKCEVESIEPRTHTENTDD